MKLTVAMICFATPMWAGGMAPPIVEYTGPKPRPAITCEWISQTQGARWKYREAWEQCRNRDDRPSVAPPEPPQKPVRPAPPEKPQKPPEHVPCACGNGFVKGGVA